MSVSEQTKKTLTVLAPVFNEMLVVGKFVERVKAELKSLDEKYQSSILLVVDKSTDGTEDFIRKICEQDVSVSAIFLSRRFGHQNSLMAGIDHCFSDFCIMMDSDLQHPPALIPEMLKLAEEGNDIVQSVRLDKINSPLRRLCSRLFYATINLISDLNVQDSAADFRLISRKVIEVLQNDIKEKQIFLRGMVSWLGFKKTYIDYEINQREGGSSKYSVSRLFRFALMGIVTFSNKPLKAAMFVGFLFSVLAFCLTAWIVVAWFMEQSMPSGWATLATLMSFFSGVQLMFLGVIGEYLGFMFEELKQRPRYIVEERFNVGCSAR